MQQKEPLDLPIWISKKIEKPVEENKFKSLLYKAIKLLKKE